MARENGPNVPDEIVNELGCLYSDASSAVHLAIRVGFPRQDIPAFNTGRIFWSTILQEAENGKIKGGAWALVRQATEDYPHNQILAGTDECSATAQPYELPFSQIRTANTSPPSPETQSSFWNDTIQPMPATSITSDAELVHTETNSTKKGKSTQPSVLSSTPFRYSAAIAIVAVLALAISLLSISTSNDEDGVSVPEWTDLEASELRSEVDDLREQQREAGCRTEWKAGLSSYMSGRWMTKGDFENDIAWYEQRIEQLSHR